MILYEYICPNCGLFTQRYPMGEQPQQVECPTCKTSSRRRYSIGAIIWRCIGATKGRVDRWRRNDGSKIPQSILDGSRAQEVAERDRKAGIRED